MDSEFCKNDNEESETSKITVWFLIIFNGGLIWEIVPEDAVVILMVFGINF